MPVTLDQLKAESDRAASRDELRHNFCYTCIYWDRTEQDHNDLTTHPGAHTRNRGCKLYPTVVFKSPDDWCGQHKSA